MAAEGRIRENLYQQMANLNKFAKFYTNKIKPLYGISSYMYTICANLMIYFQCFHCFNTLYVPRAVPSMAVNDISMPLPPSVIPVLERRIKFKPISPSVTVTAGASKPTISTDE